MKYYVQEQGQYFEIPEDEVKTEKSKVFVKGPAGNMIEYAGPRSQRTIEAPKREQRTEAVAIPREQSRDDIFMMPLLSEQRAQGAPLGRQVGAAFGDVASMAVPFGAGKLLAMRGRPILGAATEAGLGSAAVTTQEALVGNTDPTYLTKTAGLSGLLGSLAGGLQVSKELDQAIGESLRKGAGATFEQSGRALGSKGLSEYGKGLRLSAKRDEAGRRLSGNFDRNVSVINRMKDQNYLNENAEEFMPNVLKFGKNSQEAFSDMRKAKLITPEGKRILDNYSNFKTGLDRYTEDLITDKIGGGFTGTAIEAGEHAQESFLRGLDQYKSKADMNYSKFAEQYPTAEAMDDDLKKKLMTQRNELMRKIEYIDSKGNKKILEKDPAIRKEYEYMVEMIDDIIDDPTISTTDNIRRYLGSTTDWEMNTKAPALKAIKKNMYRTLGDAELRAAKRINPQLANQLQESNKIMAQALNDLEYMRSFVNEKSGDKAFNKALSNKKAIDILKRYVPDEDMKPIKAAYLNSNVSTYGDNDMGIRYEGTRANLNKNKFKSSLFNDDELNELREVVGVGDELGKPWFMSEGSMPVSKFGLISPSRALDKARSHVETMRERGAASATDFKPFPLTVSDVTGGILRHGMRRTYPETER